MPKSKAADRRPPFLSLPTWDLSDEEIEEWKQTPGLGFAAYTAECIRDGRYDGGEELYPPDSAVYREITRDAVDEAMSLLAERGMARKTEGKWHAIAPGRLEPDMRRAVAVLLARRDELPLALATALDSWKQTLDALNAPTARRPARQPPSGRHVTVTPARATMRKRWPARPGPRDTDTGRARPGRPRRAAVRRPPPRGGHPAGKVR